MEHASEFYRGTWTCGTSPQSLCLGCSVMNRSSGMCSSAICQELSDKSQMNKTFSFGSYQKTKPGFTVATQKPNSSTLSGKADSLHTQRQRGKSCETSRACWRSFLTVRALFSRNLFLQAKQLTSITTRKFCYIWGSNSTENIQNDGGTRTGSFIMPMRKAHNALSVQQFLATRNMAMVPHPPYSPDLAPCNFSCFQEYNHS
jgi:hypothetical protein